MEVLTQYLGAVQFEITARQHTLICDQPGENNGYDEGMTPPELLLASLGSCAAYYAVGLSKPQQAFFRGDQGAGHRRKGQRTVPPRQL